jgi:hypothetical protein
MENNGRQFLIRRDGSAASGRLGIVLANERWPQVSWNWMLTRSRHNGNDRLGGFAICLKIVKSRPGIPLSSDSSSQNAGVQPFPPFRKENLFESQYRRSLKHGAKIHGKVPLSCFGPLLLTLLVASRSDRLASFDSVFALKEPAERICCTGI